MKALRKKSQANANIVGLVRLAIPMKLLISNSIPAKYRLARLKPGTLTFLTFGNLIFGIVAVVLVVFVDLELTEEDFSFFQLFGS